MPNRAAVVSYHSSPLVEPGRGDSGGMTIYVRELTAALARRGLQTDVFTRATDVGDRVTELFEGVRVVPVDAGPVAPLPKEQLPVYLGEFVEGIEWFEASEGMSYDVLHSHYWHSGLAGDRLARSWSVPLVHSHHTLGLVKNRNLAPGDSPEPESRLLGERRVIGRADVLVASTSEEAEQLSCLYGADHDRLKVVHPGVDHDMFSPGDRGEARRALGLSEGPIVLYVGRIQKLKGLELAIRSIEQVVPALEAPVQLLVVGGPSGNDGDAELARLHALVAELQLEDVVRFLGPQPHERLVDFYRAADCLVVCSHSESFGLAALEAQACGTPVVATSVGGLSHVVADGESGFLVGTRDASVFAGRLKTLLADSHLRNSFSRSAVRAATRFSWENTADTLHTLYDCLIREKRPEFCTC